MRSYKKTIGILLITFIFFNNNELTAQKSRTDSLNAALVNAKEESIRLNILNELTVYLRRSYPDSALEFARQAKDIALKLEDYQQLAECYKNIGNIYNGKDNFNLSTEFYQKALEIYRDIGDSSGSAKIHNNLGALNSNQGDFAKSLEYYQKSLELKKFIGDRFGMGMTYNNIGNVHYSQGNLNLSLQYYFKSLDIRKEFNDKMGMAGCYNNIGTIYSEKKDHHSAIKYFKEAISIYIEFNDKLGIGQTYKNLANVYTKSLDYNTAINYLVKSLKIDEELDDRIGMCITLNGLAQVYNLQHRYELAINYASKAQKISEDVGANPEKKNSYKELTTAYEGLNNFNRALYFHKKFLNIKDSLFNIEKAKEIEFIESKYQLENKQLEIEKLESDNALKTFKLEKLRARQLLALIIIIISLVYIIALLNIGKKLKRRNHIIFEQNEEITTQKAELEEHRNNLEKLVKERTRDLEIAKQKAEESDRLKSSFLANMSHEIRTPMNAIIGFTNLLNEENIDLKTKTDLINQITQNGFSLLNLIDNLLDLAKIETNQIEINRREFLLNKVFEDINFAYYDIAKSKNIKLQVHNIAHELIIFSDYVRLTQLLKLLVDNAIKFTDEGTVDVGYEITENDITIYVKDTGIGMSESQINLIFARFTKIENEKRKLYRGAGLGLAICYQLASLLGGELNVESERDKGTTFFLKLPYGKFENINKKNNKLSNVSNTYDWSNKIILIAEDNESNFQYFRMIFNKTKANILRAENGKKAVKLSEENDVDLILMDIKMPDMDGLEATRLIKRIKPEIPIIAQTAYAMESDEKASMDAGCSDFIQKPINRDLLFSKISSYF